MKFAIKKAFGNCRLSCMSEVGHHIEKVWNTPMCIMYSKSGSIPHLTPDVHKYLSSSDLPLQLPLNYLMKNTKVLQKFARGIGSFIGAQDSLLYVCVQDPAFSAPTGYNSKLGIAIWSHHGKMEVQPENFMETIEAALPDIYQIICDSDTKIDSSHKRICKSVDRSLDYLDRCLEFHTNSKVLSNTISLGSVQGGFNIEQRVKSARETSKRNVEGFVIEGFQNNGPETEFIMFEDIKELIEQTVKELPEHKPRVIHGPWKPDNVIRLIENGIDIFDSSYPFIVSERGSALVFSSDYESALPEKRISNDETSKATEINLGDKQYFSDFSPVLESCQCYTCRSYSKAYIHHLLVTKEMLAGILLMLHNCYHWLQFFEAIRKSLESGQFKHLKEKILSYSSRSGVSREEG